jgi:HK97 family phage portal protein
MGLMKNAVAGVMRWAATPPPGDDYWYADVGSGQNHAGIVVTPDIALKASSVFSCVKVLSETIGTMPIHMKKKIGNGGEVDAPEHPLDELIRYQPNQIQTAVEFWEMMMLHAALRGTAYAEIVPGPRGAVDQLLPLHTDRVVPERTNNGTGLRFRVTNPHTNHQRVLLPEEMLRIPGLSSDGVTGLRAVDVAAEAIGLGLGADAYAARVFSNDLNIGMALVHPKKLSVDAQRRLVHALMERFSGASNSHRPMVLQEGIKLEKVGQNATEAQLLEARKWQLMEVARYWLIPLHMLGIEQTNTTSEQRAQDFVKYTLRPWVRKIEQAIRRDLIVAKNIYSARINMDALLRADSAARADYFSKALGSGGSPAWMSANEVRAIEGLPPSDQAEANRLGIGTNPRTDQPKALTDGTDRGAAARLIRKEVTAIRKAAMRYAGDEGAFRIWVTAFYGGHVSTVMDGLGIPKDAARAYCDHVRNEVLNANDIEAMIDRWDETRAAEIAETLEQHRGN